MNWEPWLDTGSRMAVRMHAFDWSRTSLGSPEDWPQSLRTAVALMLDTREAVCVAWGDDLVSLYNDAMMQLLGPTGPTALGRPFRELWPASRSMLDAVRSGKAQHAVEGIGLAGGQQGGPGVLCPFSLTPLRDEAGSVAGLYCVAEESGRSTPAQGPSDSRGTIRDEEKPFRVLAEANLVGVGFGDFDGNVTYLNDEMLRMMGYSRADHDAGRINFLACFAAEDHESAIETDRLLRRDGVALGYQRTFVRPDGGRTPYIGAAAMVAPGSDQHVSIALDLTPVRAAEAALRESEARLRLAQEVAGVGTFEWDIRNNINRWSPEIERLYGIPEGSFGGTYEEWAALIHPDDLPETERRVKTALETGRFAAEWRVVQPGGEVVWLLARAIIEKDADGTPLRMIGVNVDITERVRSEQRLKMLMAELDHRVKNVLAVVQSIAQHSLRGADPDAVGRFLGRLSALAQSHALLSESRWEGAGMSRLLSDAVAPYRNAAGSNVVLSGPDLVVAPRAAQTLTLAFHEMVTNASKYGALSAPKGTVSIEWALEGDSGGGRLQLRWRETGGPPLDGPPSHKGFGTRLIEQTIAYELNGEVLCDYRREGLRITVDIPHKALKATGEATEPP